ncbi:restriction endonuclease subunit S [Acidovorax temperans]|uniref:restriction endonuclease subunit S n=1 Tax=Acidovorax temperans TaxID=80878 RepID=UPI002358B76E|nr:restriction endonuclease subunit S [Acidovorax temperans]WCT26070.1 restriction endonuclease subunit S [Acidovorax temperans]
MTRLGDVSDMLVGFAFKSAGFLDADADGVRILRGDNVQQGYIRWGDKTKKWPVAQCDGLERYQLAEDDVILAMDRPIVGDGLKMAWIRPEDLPALLVQRVCRLRGKPDMALTKFIRYVLAAPDFSGHIHRITTGANIPHISGKDIAAYEFELPDLEDQVRIVECLSAYDDLIATNQRRIALLEDAARRLYREWFVHLRFPGHESVPVKDGVPEGWRKTPIAEQTSFLNRGIAPKYDDAAKGRVINQKCIRDGRISMEPARRQSKDVKPDRLVQMGDVLINSTGAGTLGRVAQVRAPIDDCTVDTHVTIARPIDEGSWTYFGQALLNLEPVFSEMGKGATNQLELSRSDIGAVEIWLPPQHLHAEFERLVGPMLVQAEQLSVANLSLEKARDLLLPKLMSGQLDVSGIALPAEVAA